MGKLKGNAIKGSVGTLNFYEVNGETRVRRKPGPTVSLRTQRRKRSDAQKQQISKFGFVSRFAHRMKDLFNQTFECGPGEVGFNQAMRYMMASAIEGEAPAFRIDFSRVMVARGTALKAEGAQVSLEPGKLVFTWEDNSRYGLGSEADQAILVAYNETHEFHFYTLEGGTRATGRGELDLTRFKFPLKEVHTWISFRKKNGVAADSVYLGKVELG